jgi:putative oxidoreductase
VKSPTAPPVAQDVVLLVARVLVGVVLLAHGVPKLTDGLGATADGFATMGIPLPQAAAAFAIAAEVGGAVLLIAGALTPVAGVLVAAQMAGAFWFAHRGLQPLVGEGGWELVGVIGALALVLAVVGPGRFAIDGVRGRTRTRSSTSA